MNNIKFLTNIILPEIILFCVSPSKFRWIFSYLQSYGYHMYYIIYIVICVESLAHGKEMSETPQSKRQNLERKVGWPHLGHVINSNLEIFDSWD